MMQDGVAPQIRGRLQMVETAIDELTYLIWSNEQHGWRRPGGVGYSADVEEAGRFTHHRAFEEYRQALVRWRSGSPYPDIPVTERDVMLVLGRRELGNGPPMAGPASPDLGDVQAYALASTRYVRTGRRS
jgi:hypothetical protein